MFGFDFAGLADAIPKFQELAEKIGKEFSALVEEQKAQRALLEKIADKVGVEKE